MFTLNVQIDFFAKKFFQNGPEFCDLFGMASPTQTKLVEGKTNETRRSMPVDSARYKVTVWLCPPGIFTQTNTFAREKRFFPCVQWQKNQPTRLQFKDMEKCCNPQLEDYPIFRDDQTMIQTRIRCTMLKTVSFWLRKKGRRKKKITQEEERERRLRDMPTRYV